MSRQNVVMEKISCNILTGGLAYQENESYWILATFLKTINIYLLYFLNFLKHHWGKSTIGKKSETKTFFWPACSNGSPWFIKYEIWKVDCTVYLSFWVKRRKKEKVSGIYYYLDKQWFIRDSPAYLCVWE